MREREKEWVKMSSTNEIRKRECFTCTVGPAGAASLVAKASSLRALGPSSFFLRERDFLSYYEGKEERVWDFVYKVTFMGRPLFTKKNSVVVVVVLFLLRV